jgi:hypothetical protein
MAGVRLHHPTFRSCTFVVELEQDFASRRPRVCPSCSQPGAPKSHDRKAVHLRLDANGDVIVSPDVLASLRTVFLAGMDVVNEIENPPTQLVGAVAQPTQLIVEQRLNPDQNSAPYYAPGRTKYESRDRLWASVRNAIRSILGEE